MNKFAKALGFFMISVFMVSIPFLTGLRIGRVGELEFFTLLGTTLTIGGVVYLTILFFFKYE